MIQLRKQICLVIVKAPRPVALASRVMGQHITTHAHKGADEKVHVVMLCGQGMK